MTIKQIADNSLASINKNDIYLLLKMLKKKGAIKRVLEIGTWKGYSAKLWVEAFNPEKLATVEIDSMKRDAIILPEPQYEYYWGCNSHEESVKNKIYETFDGEIDFLFIDGDHTYGGVRKDWEFYSPLVRSGGVIVLHDNLYSAPNVEVDKLWNEIKGDYDWVEIKSKGSTGMGVLLI